MRLWSVDGSSGSLLAFPVCPQRTPETQYSSADTGHYSQKGEYSQERGTERLELQSGLVKINLRCLSYRTTTSQWHPTLILSTLFWCSGRYFQVCPLSRSASKPVPLYSQSGQLYVTGKAIGARNWE